MGLVSRTAMNAVEAVIATAAAPIGIREIHARAGCGKIRTVRSALSQLVEEGRVVRGGVRPNPTYTPAMAQENAA